MDGPDFKDRILGRLSGLGEITCRPMLGGYGVYWGETIFGIFFRERLYLKVDEQSKGDYLARGMGPFRPNERQTLKSYYEVPPEVLDDLVLELAMRLPRGERWRGRKPIRSPRSWAAGTSSR